MLFADMAVPEGEEVPAGTLIQPKVEAEVAFVIGKDLAEPDLTMSDLMSAIEYALPANRDRRQPDFQLGHPHPRHCRRQCLQRPSTSSAPRHGSSTASTFEAAAW